MGAINKRFTPRWELRPGDLPSARAQRREPRLRGLQDNAAYRLFRVRFPLEAAIEQGKIPQDAARSMLVSDYRNFWLAGLSTDEIAAGAWGAAAQRIPWAGWALLGLFAPSLCLALGFLKGGSKGQLICGGHVLGLLVGFMIAHTLFLPSAACASAADRLHRQAIRMGAKRWTARSAIRFLKIASLSIYGIGACVAAILAERRGILARASWPMLYAATFISSVAASAIVGSAYNFSVALRRDRLFARMVEDIRLIFWLLIEAEGETRPECER